MLMQNRPLYFETQNMILFAQNLAYQIITMDFFIYFYGSWRLKIQFLLNPEIYVDVYVSKCKCVRTKVHHVK